MKRSYEDLLHAMQSGVAMELTYENKSVDPKHLRVGINSALVDNAAIARLLIQKGIITEEEYVESVRLEMEREVERYEKQLSDRYGKEIKLY